MDSPVSGVDVFGNMLRIERQKAELLKSVSSFYEVMIPEKEASDTDISDCAADVIFSVYSLCRNLGIADSLLDESLENSFKLNKYNSRDVWYNQ